MLEFDTALLLLVVLAGLGALLTAVFPSASDLARWLLGIGAAIFLIGYGLPWLLRFAD